MYARDRFDREAMAEVHRVWRWGIRRYLTNHRHEGRTASRKKVVAMVRLLHQLEKIESFKEKS